MHHDLIWILWCVGGITLAPIIADSIRKDVSSLVKSGRRDGTSSGGVALQSVLGNSVPEMESAIRASSAERAMYWMERDGVDRVDVGHVVLGWISVTFE